MHQCVVSIPEDVLRDLDKLAEVDERSRAGEIRFVLKLGVAERWKQLRKQGLVPNVE